MTFEELGALLRTERERRGIDIATVSEKLRISARIIRSLESGDPSGMPQAVYVRGFIRSYASFLDIDAGELAPTISSLYPEEDNPTYNATLMEEESESTAGSGRIFIYLAILVCCVGAGVFWMYYGNELVAELGHNMASVANVTKTPTAAKPAPAAQKGRTEKSADARVRETPSDNRTPTPPISVKQLENQQKSTGRSEQAAQATRAEPTQPQRPEQQSTRADRAAQDTMSTAGENQPRGREQTVPPGSGPVVNAAPSAAERGAQPVGKHQLILTAQAECWVHSNADNADTRQFSLRKGDTFVLTFSNKLVLKLGSAGGVRLRYDGRELPPVGNLGQVRTLTFPLAE